MNPTLCARPGCGVALTPAQLLHKRRYCSPACGRCAPKRTPGSLRDIAEVLGISHSAVRTGLQTKRIWREGDIWHYVPGVNGRPRK